MDDGALYQLLKQYQKIFQKITEQTEIWDSIMAPSSSQFSTLSNVLSRMIMIDNAKSLGN
jgi:hypothetical protein